jgi:transcriptional regulator with XRE-family HTH domain
MDKKVFSIWLKDFMKRHQIRQYQLAKKSGIDSNMIQNYRNGRNHPNLFNTVIVATALSMLSGVERKEILESIAVAALKG